jgi:hypothetical protein
MFHRSTGCPQLGIVVPLTHVCTTVQRGAIAPLPRTPSTPRYVASVVNKVFGRQAIVVPDAPEGRVGVSVADMGAALAQV